ncbi:S-acyl fatty acid synthase thioesterase, medium chain-like [Babylonia areolata]|uniref:S-acyl fatty acid synthase thioesterase, medium chain-like n=1 Tax=Babylonia areolata TaxID=304850 RepID=UPI003FCFDE70
MSSSSTCPLMNCRCPRPEASHRLFCFPWAGGGSIFYANWANYLPPNIEVYGITLRGRETRMAEKPCASSQETVAEIASTIASELGDKPIIFFGHSMGCLLAYETAVLLKKVYGRQPEHMYLSGVSAPHTKSRRENMRDLSDVKDEEFHEHLKQLGGTPQELLDNQELLKIYLPALKADYTMVYQIAYERPTGPAALTCNFTFFDGIQDEDHNYDDWKELTQGSFSLYKMPGGHFYLKEPYNYLRILEFIRRDFPQAFGC